MNKTELLRAVRAEHGTAALVNLAPLAIEARVLPEFDVAAPETLYRRSMTVTPVPNPLLVALLEEAGAAQRGTYTWSVGLGSELEPYNPAPLRVLLNSIHPAAVIAEDQIVQQRRTKTFHEERYHRDNRLVRVLQGTAARNFVSNERLNAIGNSYRLITEEENPFGGGVTISVAGSSLFFRFVTDDLRVPDEAVEDGVFPMFLDLNRAGRGRRDPKPARPAEAFTVLDWFASREWMIVDPSEGDVRKLRRAVARRITAWPTPGRPAEATVALGRRHWERLDAAGLGSTGHPTSETSVLVDVDSELTGLILETANDDGSGVDPGVLDVARMAAASPVADERLRPHQQMAVGLHLATDLGFVNACAVGLGKTVMTLMGMRLRAATRKAYRGLVVVEANVRAQWAEEGAIWFPEAVFFTVAGKNDAARLAEVLARNPDRPVVIITSYAVVGNAVDQLEAGAPIKPVAAPAPTPAVEVAEQPLGQLSLLFDDGERVVLNDAAVSEETMLDGPVPTIGELLAGIFFDDLVADEAVVLANTSSKQSRALWALRRRAQVALPLTGTPVDKSVDDIGRLVAWVCNDPELFYGHRLSNNFDLSSPDGPAEFAKALGPRVLRFDQSEISDELPSFIPTVERVAPTPSEAALEHGARFELKKHFEELLRLMEQAEGQSPSNEDLAETRAALQNARGAWLGGTTLARTAAADPESLRFSESAGAALLAAQGLIDAACEDGGTKRRRAVELIQNRVAAGHQVLLFTEFAQAARAILATLAENGVAAGGVLGGGGRVRDENIRRFRAGELDVLICTASGEKGLNLQCASVVIHYDLPWTPRKIVQRTGRAARIGSTNNEVEVIFMLAEGTIEERVAAVVVARAVTMMQALDAHRGVKLSDTEMGKMLGGLVDEVDELELGDGENALLDLTRLALAA